MYAVVSRLVFFKTLMLDLDGFFHDIAIVSVLLVFFSFHILSFHLFLANNTVSSVSSKLLML